MPSDRYQFGDYTLNIDRASLTCGGEAVALRPKSFALLEYLVMHAGRLVSKDELLAAVWAGVVVTEDSLTRCVSEVRAALGDTQQQIIKTVSRRGYLFAAAVLVLSPHAGESAVAVPERSGPGFNAAAAPLAKRLKASWLALPALLLVGALVIGWHNGWRSANPPARPLSVVVLPFVTSGTTSADMPESLAGALTDDLTSALARLHGVHVVSASNALAFKGRQLDVRQIGTDLRVRYAVEGSVMREGGNGEPLRINARLIDSQTATTLWSDQFDLEQAGRPLTRDDIVLRLASALDVELVLAHSKRLAGVGPTALDSEDLALQCLATLRMRAGAAGAAGDSLCRQALQKDPQNVRALARLAWHHADRVSRGQTTDAAAGLAVAEGYAARALAVNSGYPEAHCAQAAVLEGQHRVRDAIASAQRCLELNPSSANAYRMLMIEHFFVVEPDKTREYASHLLSLSPRDPRRPTALLFMGWACLQQGRAAEAVDWLRSASANSPSAPNITLALAVALVLSGHDVQGRAAMTSYLGLPGTIAKTVSQWDHRPDGNLAFAAFAGRVNAALRAAGMPE